MSPRTHHLIETYHANSLYFHIITAYSLWLIEHYKAELSRWVRGCMASKMDSYKEKLADPCSAWDVMYLIKVGLFSP